MKTLIIMVIAFVFTASGAFSQGQNDYKFQQTYKEIQKLLDKDTKNLSEADVSQLRNFFRLREDEYGSKYQSSIKNIKTQISAKISSYETLLREKEYSRSKEQELTQEQQEHGVTRDSLTASREMNTELIKKISELNLRIKSLDKERSRLVKANKDLQQKNIETQKMLAQSQKTVQNIITMLNRNNAAREGTEGVPQGQLDSLQQAECGVTSLLKDNFVLTLRRLEQDQAFVDSSRAYFKKYQAMPDNIMAYVNSGTEIINRLRLINSDCAQRNADEINREIEDFTDFIQKDQSSFWTSLKDFFTSTWGIIIIVGIVGIIVVVLVVKSGRNKPSVT